MRAAVFTAPGKLELDDVEPPPHGPSDVEITVEACGICGTDLHILEDPPGHPANLGVVIGHEFVGRISAKGAEVLALEVGDRVVVEANIMCGMCPACKGGMASQCANFTSMGIFQDGGMAQRVVAPARLCHVISQELPAAVAALAEPLSCVVNGLKTARPMPGDAVAIIGGGAVGLLYAAMYKLSGASKVLVVEPAEFRRTVALQMGATDVKHPNELCQDDYEMFDITVDAVGSQMDSALRLTRAGGQALLFGLNSKVTNQLQQYEITRRELTVHGVYVGSYVFPRAVRILETSGIDFAPMISTYPLEEIHTALDQLRSGADVKTIIDLG